MILCVPVTIFETCCYGKVGRTGWPIGEICQVMVLRVSSEYNLFRKTNPSTTKIMTAEKLLVKRCKTRWTKGQNWTVFYLYFSQKRAIWGRRRTKTWIFCYGSHLHDQEKLLKHLRAREGAWAAKRRPFFMGAEFANTGSTGCRPGCVLATSASVTRRPWDIDQHCLLF